MRWSSVQKFALAAVVGGSCAIAVQAVDVNATAECLGESVSQDCSTTSQSVLLQISRTDATKRVAHESLQDDSHAIEKMKAAFGNSIKGFVLVRVPKTSHHLIQGIAGRIASNYGIPTILAMEDIEKAKVYPKFVYYGNAKFKNLGCLKDMPNLHRITMVRDPAERCLDSFYDLVQSNVAEGVVLWDDAKIAWLTGDCAWFKNSPFEGVCKRNRCPDFMAKRLEPTDGASVQDITSIIDWIGVTERLDEMLVILHSRWYFDVPLTDMLYVAGEHKCAGARDADESDRWYEEPALSEHSQAVRDAAEQLRSPTSRDMQLLQAANAMMDAAVGLYGATFQSDLAKFQGWLQTTETECRCAGPTSDRFFDIDCVNNLVQQQGWS